MSLLYAAPSGPYHRPAEWCEQGCTRVLSNVADVELDIGLPLRRSLNEGGIQLRSFLATLRRASADEMSLSGSAVGGSWDKREKRAENDPHWPFKDMTPCPMTACVVVSRHMSRHNDTKCRDSVQMTGHDALRHGQKGGP